MEIKGVLRKCGDVLRKYRYAVLILAIGLVLMLIPGKDTSGNISDPTPASGRHATGDLEKMLAQILEKVSGAGKVSVLLTTAAGEETIYQMDEDLSDSSNSYTTVTITDADRNQTGLVRRVNQPIYLGALVVCDGADDPTVRLAIVNAVSRVTGLGANQISVLKMK